MKPDTGAALAPHFCGPPLDDGRPHIGELVERIGFGWAQARAGILGGGVWVADGAELMLISSVARAVGEEWGMSPMARGFIVTLVFCGMFIGNFASGPIGDNYGRRHLILASYLGIFVFSVCSVLSTSVVMLGSVRLLVGIAIGLGQPASISLGLEITPTYWRAAMNGACFCLFCPGEAYTALLLMNDDPYLDHLHWRRLLLLGAIPSAIFFVGGLAFLNQSPAFLAVKGRREEAMVVLESMRNSNGAGDFSVEYQELRQVSQKLDEPAKSWFSEWSLIFNQQFGGTTLIVMFSCFTANFVLYGSIYAFPQILRNLDMGRTPAMQLLLGALVEIPGNVAGILCGTYMPRKVMMKFFLTFLVGALFSFMIGIQHLHLWVGSFMATGGFYGMKFFLTGYFNVIYLYAAEVFPTEIRTTGSSVCLGSGRLAAMIAPVAYEAISSAAKGGGAEAYLVIILGLVMTNAGLINLLPFETFGQPLGLSRHSPRASADCDDGEHGLKNA